MLIQKYLSSVGICSRREGEYLIKSKKIKINGEIVEKPYTQINPDTDIIEIDNKIIKPIINKYVYIALYKPINILSSKKGYAQNDRTIYDLLPEEYHNLGYAGRLDKDSEGLVILSNDGNYINTLTHPRYMHEKEYEITLDKAITEIQINQLEKGIYIQDKDKNRIKTMPTILKKIKSNIITMILREGKNRQIRKMCEIVNLKVINLKRIRINNILLGNLHPGQWKFIKI